MPGVIIMTAKPPNTSTLTSEPQSETTAELKFEAVLDEEGNTVDRGGVTYSKALTFKGSGDPVRRLEIRDDIDQLTTVDSGSSGSWIKAHTLSDFKRYKLIAMELDSPFNFSKPPYQIVLASETPIIDKVIGENGEIDDGDIYDGVLADIKGFAPPGMVVEALNHGSPTGKTATVDGDGLFNLTFDGLTAGRYKITIKAANGKESGVFEFLVPWDIELILDRVYDSRGEVIAENDTTYDVRATAYGDAWPCEGVQLLNHNNPVDGAIGTADENGRWKIDFELSAPNWYCLAVQALYGEGETSKPPYRFYVKEDVKLSLDDVIDSKGPILEDGTTYDKRVRICGYARPGKRVQLRNHGEPIGGATTPADLDSGYWEIELDVLPLTYKITVEGLYDDHEVTKPPRTFHVALDVTLSLDDVLESEDGPSVPEGETTYKNMLFIIGHARPGESIQLFNYGAPIEGAIANADPLNGAWKFLLKVIDGEYCLTAQANYGDNEVTDPPRTFIVSAIIQPHDTRVFDTDGLVDDNGTTPFDFVVARGYAAPLAAIKLKINGVIDPKPEPTDEEGKWARLVHDLEYGTRYTIIAVADYSGNAESNPWTFTPEAATIVPILGEVTDPEGNKVGGSDGGPTLHTKLTFTGQAKPHGTVEILNGASSLGEATADGKGNFRKVIFGLPETTYDIKIRGLYAGNPESTQRWTFTIEQAVRPTIGRIFDVTADILPDGYTYETTVTVEGRAHRLQKVQIFDGDDFLREVPVEGNNSFKAELGGLSFKNYDLRIKPLYGSDLPYSAVHGFSVITRGVLSIDNVTDPNGNPIPDNGSISENKVFTFNGRGAPPNTYVNLYRDNDIFAGRRLADEDGTFHVNTGSHPLGGPYKFYLKGVDGRTSQNWYIRISR